MLRTDDIWSTIAMFQEENLDVRAVTLGVNLLDCAGSDAPAVAQAAYDRIALRAARLSEVCVRVSGRYGIPIVNRRVAVSPISAVAAGLDLDGLTTVARALDAAAHEVGVDYIGGYTALVHKGATASDRRLIESLPDALTATRRVCASVNVAASHAGINMDAILSVAQAIKLLAMRTADQDGFGCAKLVTFANIPEDSPFMAGAYLGLGEPDAVVNIGVSGPGVVNRAILRLRESRVDLTLADLAEEIKLTAFRVTRIGELIGREVAAALGVPFGIVDLSLAPTPQVGDSVGEILESLGIREIGAPGTTAALALLNDAVKKGGAFASSSVGGLSGAFIPVSEDARFAAAAARGSLRLEKLEAMTSVCSVGLDMIAVPGDTSAETLAALIADEMAIGVVNHKTTAVRVIPVPGKAAGDRAVFGGLFGETPILPLANQGADDFVRLGGRIPAPLSALRN